MTDDTRPEAVWMAVPFRDFLELALGVARAYRAHRSGESSADVLQLPGPYLEDYHADPVVFRWDDGTEVSIPAPVLAEYVAVRHELRSRHLAALN